MVGEVRVVAARGLVDVVRKAERELVGEVTADFLSTSLGLEGARAMDQR